MHVCDVAVWQKLWLIMESYYVWAVPAYPINSSRTNIEFVLISGSYKHPEWLDLGVLIQGQQQQMHFDTLIPDAWVVKVSLIMYKVSFPEVCLDEFVMG